MKLTDAVNDLLDRINQVLQEEQYTSFMLERTFRMKEDIVNPALKLLGARPKFKAGAEALRDLYAAVEEYVVTWQPSTPDEREKRRHKIEGLKSLVRRELLPAGDKQAEVEQLLDDIRKWQWTTKLDQQGRLVYTTASGAVVPPRSLIAEQVGAQVIEQACKAQTPYADRMRPRDIRGEPGGMIFIEEGERVIVVGDLHGRYDNLEHILKDKNNLQDIVAGRAHLIFTGDAVHPRSSACETPEAYEDSFCVMLLIMTLKAENPFNIHYVIGNHDASHVGGLPAGRGQVRQDKMFEKFVTQKFGASVFKRYCEFVEGSPVAAKVKMPNGWIILVHACLSPLVMNEQGMINAFVQGRQAAVLQDLLWSRNYEKETIQKGLQAVGAKFVISGHTSPNDSRAARYGFEVLADAVFAHVHDLQIVMTAQGNVFGYADLDMKRPLPDRITDMVARDGRPAFRVLRPRGPAPTAPIAAAEVDEPVAAADAVVEAVEVVEDAEVVEAEIVEEPGPAGDAPPKASG